MTNLRCMVSQILIMKSMCILLNMEYREPQEVKN